MLNNPILPNGGAVRVPELPGFGMEIKPEAWTRPAAVARVTTAQLRRAKKAHPRSIRTRKGFATTESGMGAEVGTYLLHSPSLICGRRRRRRYHQAQTLQQHNRPLRRSTPDELATLALAVLHVDVAAGILQAAILEGAVDEDPVVQHQVLVFEKLVFVSSHQRTRLSLPGSGRKRTVNLSGVKPSWTRHRQPHLFGRRKGGPHARLEPPEGFRVKL